MVQTGIMPQKEKLGKTDNTHFIHGKKNLNI